jgi:seryl-tRNA(Sec) selenium transferase
MKVGKEEMVGLVRAIEVYLAQDHEAVYAQWRAQLTTIEQAVSEMPGVTTERTETYWSEGIPATKLWIDSSVAGTSAEQVAAALAVGDPGVRVGVAPGVLTVVPQFLEMGQELIVAERLRQALRVLVGVR